MIQVAGYPTRILVVDDNPNTCAALCTRLELQGGYAACAVESGLAALEILARSAFDVVLCDLRLRGEMDGIAVTRELQRSWPEIRVVVFTGVDDGASKVAALNAGAFFFLSKPINFDELELAIDRINSVRRTERLHRFFETLNRISYELQQSFDLDRVAKRIVAGACELGYRRSRLYLYDPADEKLVGRAAGGLDMGHPFEGYLVPLDALPMIRSLFHTDRPTFWNKEALLLHHGHECTEPWMTDFDLHQTTWIDCPLVVQGRRIGMLSVDDWGRHDVRYTEDDRQLMAFFSGVAAQALANCRLYQKEALANASLRSILHEAPDAVVTTDLHGKINFASPSCERVIGWQAEQLLGRKAAELYQLPGSGGGPSGTLVARDIMKRLNAGQTLSNLRVDLATADGRPRPVSLSVSLLHGKGGEAIGTLGFLKDLGPLDGESRRYRDLLEGFGYGTLLVEGENISYANRKAERLLRRSGDQLLGKSLFALVPREMAAELKRSLGEVRKGGGETALDLVFLLPGGKSLPIRAAASAVQAGSEVHVALGLYDKSELALLLQSGRLMALGQMTAGVAHEINNPLNNLFTALRGLEEQLGPERENIKEELAILERNSQRIRSIVAQLRQFSRPSEINKQPLSLNHVVRDAMAFFASRFKNRNIELVMELQDDLPKILGDSVRLQQVVVNLAFNAEEAMEGQKEPMVLRLSTRAEAISEIPAGELEGRSPSELIGSPPSPSAERQAEGRGPIRVVLEVEDSGPGIPEELREMIFDPFFTTKPPSQGTGLGLAISKSILELHEGTLTVASGAGGRGALFRIELPALAEPAAGRG
jgi:PAS domain S-box-containing protein